MKIKCICKNCDTPFETYQHRIDVGRGIYCCLKCYREYKNKFGLTDDQKKRVKDATKKAMNTIEIRQKVINGMSSQK